VLAQQTAEAAPQQLLVVDEQDANGLIGAIRQRRRGALARGGRALHVDGRKIQAKDAALVRGAVKLDAPAVQL